MDFTFEEAVFNLEIAKAQDALQSESDICFLTLMESVLTGNEAVIEESLKNLADKVSDVIAKILKAIREFFKNLRVKLEVKVQQVNMNKKLEELKNLMAAKRVKAGGKKTNCFDVKKYKDYYTEFINRYTAELIRGMETDFKNVDQYEKWRKNMLDQLSDFNYKLTDEEQWRLSVTINSAVDLSTHAAQNREKNLKMVEDDGTRSIQKLEKYYTKIDVEHTTTDFDGKKIRLLKMKNSFLTEVVTKISNCIKSAAAFMCKHAVASVLALIALLIAL